MAEEEQQSDHTMIIQDALQQGSVEMGEEHHLVVSSDDMEGIKTVTVYTQGEDTSQFIVYVQTDEQMTEALWKKKKYISLLSSDCYLYVQ